MDPREKIVYFVRHGQSEANAKPVFQGLESPLSPEGRKQAGHIAQRLTKIPFETLISSPVARAKETTEIISGVTGKQPEYSELFVERKKPSALNTDRPHSDKEAQLLWRKWEKSMYGVGGKVDDGENFAEIVARADEAMAFLQNRKEQVLIVVTHGFFLRTLVARVLLDKSLSGEAFYKIQRRASIENTGLTALRYDTDFEGNASWRLWVYNDHAHLG